jgi:hypothetical protein
LNSKTYSERYRDEQSTRQNISRKELAIKNVQPSKLGGKEIFQYERDYGRIAESGNSCDFRFFSDIILCDVRNSELQHFLIIKVTRPKLEI